MKKNFLIRLKQETPYIIFVLPAFIIYTVLTIWPLAQTFFLSFTNWDGYAIHGLDFVGLKNFERVMQDRNISTAITNTIGFSIVFPLIITILAIPLALALTTKMKTANLQRAIFFFPSVPSAIILGYLWAYILAPTGGGLLNTFLGTFGVKPVMWLATPALARASLVGVNVWAAVGWHACVYIAKLQTISPDYYEAARIDGANALQRFRYITLPMLAPAMTVSVLLLMLGAMKTFDLPFALTKGGPGKATTMLSQSIILAGFVERTYGKATAMSVIFFFFIVIISIIQLTLMKKREVE